jgi:hypothetical protein
MLKIQFSNMPSNRMSAALSVLAPRIFCEMFLRAPQALEFSHGLGPNATSSDVRFCAACGG